MAGLSNLSKFFENPLFTDTIREVPVKASYIGSRFLPSEDTYDMDFNETVLTRQADMASIVDSGAELPLTDRDPVRRISGEIADIGQSYIVSKKELAAMMDKGNDGKRKMAIKQVLGKAARVKENLDARIEWMRWQALGNGIMAYNKDGVMFSIDFGVPADNKKTVTTKWDDTDPTILADYEAAVQAYKDLNGEAPDVFVTSSAVILTMINDVTLRKQVTGDSTGTQLITIDQLNTFLKARNQPPVEAFDTKVTYRDVQNGGTRVSQRLLNDKKGVFLKEGGEIGVQLMGPTVENDMNPGIFARSFTMERPMREVVEVVAASMPKIVEPNYIMQMTVLL